LKTPALSATSRAVIFLFDASWFMVMIVDGHPSEKFADYRRK
jgi:hypothetical protein